MERNDRCNGHAFSLENGGMYLFVLVGIQQGNRDRLKRLWHWLKRFGINSFGFSLDENGVPCFEKCYHASGHASREDITWAIERIDPDFIVPIHTEARDWFEKHFENVILVDEGKHYEL